MNEIAIDFSSETKFTEKLLTKKVLKTALKQLGQPTSVEVCLSVVSDSEIQKINNNNRGVNKVTDVLSFPALNINAGEKINQNDTLYEKVYLGDIVVCRPQIKRQAKEFGVTYRQEFMRMVLHSLLHLLGYDHIKEDDEIKMHAVEYPIYQKLTKIKLS